MKWNHPTLNTLSMNSSTPVNTCFLRMKLTASIFASLAIVGCYKSTHITTSAAGHEIFVTVEGNHSIDADTNRAVISSSYGNVTVERNRVRLGEGRWTTVPENAAVEVKISKHKSLVSTKSVTVSQSVQ